MLFRSPSALMLSPGLNTLRLESRLVCPLPAFTIIPASLVLDGYADTFQRLHEESACVLRSMPENLLHPYYSINHKIFSGSKQNIQMRGLKNQIILLPLLFLNINSTLNILLLFIVLQYQSLML